MTPIHFGFQEVVNKGDAIMPITPHSGPTKPTYIVVDEAAGSDNNFSLLLDFLTWQQTIHFERDLSTPNINMVHF